MGKGLLLLGVVIAIALTLTVAVFIGQSRESVGTSTCYTIPNKYQVKRERKE